MLSTQSSEFFSALSDPKRIAITEMIAKNGEMTAGDICDQFKVSQPAISQHLKVLRMAKIVAVQKQAQKRVYSINPHSFTAVEDWIEKLKKNWETRFNQLDEVLKSNKQKGTHEQS